MTSPNSSGTTGRTIIVIDDDATIRRGLVLALQRSYQVFDVSTVDEGVDLVSSIEPHLVILDYNMPEKDGLVGLGMIRDISEDLPILFLTGNNEPAIRKAAISNGATAFTLKPFTMDGLLSLVEELIAS